MDFKTAVVASETVLNVTTDNILDELPSGVQRSTVLGETSVTGDSSTDSGDRAILVDMTNSQPTPSCSLVCDDTDILGDLHQPNSVKPVLETPTTPRLPPLFPDSNSLSIGSSISSITSQSQTSGSECHEYPPGSGYDTMTIPENASLCMPYDVGADLSKNLALHLPPVQPRLPPTVGGNRRSRSKRTGYMGRSRTSSTRSNRSADTSKDTGNARGQATWTSADSRNETPQATGLSRSSSSSSYTPETTTSGAAKIGEEESPWFEEAHRSAQATAESVRMQRFNSNDYRIDGLDENIASVSHTAIIPEDPYREIPLPMHTRCKYVPIRKAPIMSQPVEELFNMDDSYYDDYDSDDFQRSIMRIRGDEARRRVADNRERIDNLLRSVNELKRLMQQLCRRDKMQEKRIQRLILAHKRIDPEITFNLSGLGGFSSETTSSYPTNTAGCNTGSRDHDRSDNNSTSTHRTHENDIYASMRNARQNRCI
jgi:hypothetical protein